MTAPKTATQPRGAAPNTAGVSATAELSVARSTQHSVKLSVKQWRAVAAPEDFAARVVALACSVPFEITSPRAPDSRGPAPVRRWWRRVAFGAAIAVGAGAAAALVGRSESSLESTGVTSHAAPPELTLRAAALLDVARSERNVGRTTAARASVALAETPPAAVSGAEDVALPVQLHVPPCSCTLSAVVCSCVE